MHWNDWPMVCLALSALLALLSRRWMDAAWSACFAAFLLFDKVLPTAVPWQLKYAFLLVGVLLIASQVAGTYRRYKHSLDARH